MQRALFVGTLLGAALLNAGCQESSNNPSASTFTPRPTYENREPEGLTSRLNGFTVDPEAYFFNLAACAPPPAQCPLPPLYAEFSPLLQRAVVQNAPITLLDSATGQVLAESGVFAASDAHGVWTLDKVPTRRGAPFFVLSSALPGVPSGTLANNAPAGPPLPPLPPVPEGNYVPTLTVRPVVPAHSACVGLEALQMSDKGILEAVAKYLTTEGTLTTVADLLNPARFGGVTVFWLYRPGFPVFRVPAANTTVVASAGRVLNIEWAPPGALPPPLAPFQSTRGFFIPPGPPAPNSSLGVVAVVHPPLPLPPMGPPPVVHYEAVDSTTSDPEGRPWVLQPLDLPVAPGSVTFAGLQMYSKTPSTTPSIPPPSTCLPGQ
ncbi:hypothetical protein HJC22_01240 [Corallococcus exiguus]|uniref:hypothetical protein n=1 Tax=Corallococcus TaxID=83461 RepID=UPI000EA21A23|nr:MULTISPECIES: hypothetical protein [Corallococcus]NNC14354.1 hypothetical protein [Corallococcus exiguus]RKH31428.1 hypothetical protein D7V77_00415 [Corallococcus sp. CA041A]RKI20398.1 hypothetical protein D7Y15_01065 [Corallococcus sp. AB030]RUO91820.1 hypothetical protein D7Y11_18060 [Corallococcus sp. AB018]